jgi:23S rRNA (cytidine2498-2'-O)-methyltransferase
VRDDLAVVAQQCAEQSLMIFSALLLLTRPGFEPDLHAELSVWLSSRDVAATISEAGPGAFLIRGTPGQMQAIWQRWRDWRLESVFAREFIGVFEELTALPRGARAEPLLAAWNRHALPISELHVYAPDADSTRPLLPMAKAIENTLRADIKLSPEAYDSVLHVVFLGSEHCVIGLAHAQKSAPFPGGIARLKFPPAAPSRSTLKLDEAFLSLLSHSERARWLERGMSAVDLGACPGGWTYQLVRRGINVIAIDNGAMSDTLMRSGLVQHLREDGFRYRPKKAVDWLVCDMVEQPLKVAQLALLWIMEKRCKFAMVNLKLPMKKRYAELEKCRALALEKLGSSLVWRCKQLYHDREEVTLFLTRSEYLRS